MQEKAKESTSTNQQKNTSTTNSTNNQPKKQTLGEYIDFEEIK